MTNCTCNKKNKLIPPTSGIPVLLKIASEYDAIIMQGYFDGRYYYSYGALKNGTIVTFKVEDPWQVIDWCELPDFNKQQDAIPWKEIPPKITYLSKEESGLDWHFANKAIPDNNRNVIINYDYLTYNSGYFSQYTKQWFNYRDEIKTIYRWKEI